MPYVQHSHPWLHSRCRGSIPSNCRLAPTRRRQETTRPLLPNWLILVSYLLPPLRIVHCRMVTKLLSTYSRQLMSGIGLGRRSGNVGDLRIGPVPGIGDHDVVHVENGCCGLLELDQGLGVRLARLGFVAFSGYQIAL